MAIHRKLWFIRRMDIFRDVKPPGAALAMCLAMTLAIGMLASSCGGGSQNSCTIVSYGEQTSGAELAVNNSANHVSYLAQSFNVTATQTLLNVQLKLEVLGSFSLGQLLTVTVEGNSATNTPDGHPLATGQLNILDVTSTKGAYYTFAMGLGTVVKPGNIYWIKLAGSYGASSTNQIIWLAHDGSTGEYTGGSALYYDTGGTGWSTFLIGAFRDFVFSIGC